MTNPILAENAAPCVSVIVTTFNRAKLLAETLGSIRAQTYTDFELIIVDNMSEDGTMEYVAGLADPRIRYFRNPNYGIIATNRNYGIQRAAGKYIAFCDDDDLWFADKLRQQVALLEQNPDVALCYTNAEMFIGDNVIRKSMTDRRIRRNHFFQLLRGNYIQNSSTLVRRQMFEELGLLSTDRALFEDYEMWLRIARHHPLAGIDASLIRYRVHADNASGNRAAGTLRAIRTLKSISASQKLPWLLVQPHIGYQMLKYFFYRMAKR